MFKEQRANVDVDKVELREQMSAKNVKISSEHLPAQPIQATKANAWSLIRAVGATGAEIDIRPAARQMLSDLKHGFLPTNSNVRHYQMGQKFHRVDRYLREGIGALHLMLMPLSGLPTSIMYLPSFKATGLGTAI